MCVQYEVDDQFYLRYCMRAYCTAKAVGSEQAAEAVCSAVSHYAAECARHGVAVAFRSQYRCREYTIDSLLFLF